MLNSSQDNILNISASESLESENNAEIPVDNFKKLRHDQDHGQVEISSPNIDIKKKDKLLWGHNSRTMKLFLFYGLSNIFRGIIILIIGPFFPSEAEDKGASATEIGIVIGALDFTSIFMAPIYGKYIINRFGPHRVITISYFGISFFTIVFGCLDQIENRFIFIGSAILVRVIIGLFDAGIYPSAMVIFSNKTPDTVASSVAIFELFFGIGAIIGPITCGILIESIKYTLTYSIVGVLGSISALLIFFFAPKDADDTTILDSEEKNKNETDGYYENKNTFGFWELLKVPTVLLVIFSLSTTAASIGFITTTLDLHYTELSSTMSGALFSSGTAIYVFSNPIWGYLSDKKFLSKSYLIFIGTALIILSFSIIGPLPFLPFDKAVWSGFVGYAIHGIGIGAPILIAYPYSLEAALDAGLPDDNAGYSLVSSLYTTTFCTGNTIGPLAAGVLFDLAGFRWGTLFVIALELLVILALILINIKRRSIKKNKARSMTRNIGTISDNFGFERT